MAQQPATTIRLEWDDGLVHEFKRVQEEWTLHLHDPVHGNMQITDYEPGDVLRVLQTAVGTKEAKR